MKTQIIQLHKNDDYISVRDKMSWSQTNRILLVWPRKGHVLESQLELNLVMRHAFALGAQLALVTQSANVRFIAQQIGVPVFDSPRLAQDTHWRAGRRKNLDLHWNDTHARREELGKLIQPQSTFWLKHPIIRVVSFGMSVLAIFILAIFILPSATIVLRPKIEVQSMIFSVAADPSLKTINLSTGSLPTYSQEVVVEGLDSLPASGSVLIPNKAAKTGLRFSNIANHDITIPAGTVVTTIGADLIRFKTASKDEITVGPGESVTVSSQAITPGASGNLPANSLVAIEGDLGLDLTVTNPYPASGGTDASVPAPTNRDVYLLRERLRNELTQKALTQIKTELPIEDMIIAPSVRIIETLDESITPAVGDPGKQLNLALRLRIQSQVVSGETLRNMVMPILDANLDPGYSSVPETIKLSHLSIPEIGQDGNAQWTMQATRQVQTDIPVNTVIDMVKGMSLKAAMNILDDTLPLNDNARINMTPTWWPRLPLLPLRIQVIQEGAE